MARFLTLYRERVETTREMCNFLLQQGSGAAQMTKDIIDQPTCSVEELGRVFRLSKNPAYEAVKRGDFPSIRVGSRIRIPTAPLRQMLGIDSAQKESAK